MIVEHAILSIDPSRIEEFTTSISGAFPLIEAAPGCHGIEVRQQVEDDSQFLLLVRWDSVADHMAFRESDVFEQWKALTRPFYTALPINTHFVEPLAH
jgi:heme-degrading monooxygenase HmoA